jgi:hypothetical protein
LTDHFNPDTTLMYKEYLPLKNRKTVAVPPWYGDVTTLLYKVRNAPLFEAPNPLLVASFTPLRVKEARSHVMIIIKI